MSLTDSQGKLTEFLSAVREDAHEQADALLKTFPEYAHVRVPGTCWDLSLEHSDSETCAPIHYCAVRGRAKMAKLLLEAGADSNGSGYEGNNGDANGHAIPIALATWEGDLETMAVLLDHGADPNGNNSEALRTAMWHHRGDKVQLLLSHGAAPTLHIAIGLGMMDHVRTLLETHSASTRDGRDGLPMETAAHFGQHAVADLLVEHGAEVTLIQACGLGMLDRVQAWIEERPDRVNEVEVQDSPLIAASRNGHADVVAYLLERGAEVNLAANEGGHDLLAIDVVANVDVIDLLAEAGAEMCHVYRSFTPLMRTLGKGRPDKAAVAAFVRHGGLGRSAFRIRLIHIRTKG